MPSTRGALVLRERNAATHTGTQLLLHGGSSFQAPRTPSRSWALPVTIMNGHFVRSTQATFEALL